MAPRESSSSSDLDTEIDKLYQLPPSEFTAARNGLAKRAGGSDGARIKSLEKPHLAAWAVNQLYWRQRKTHDQLVKAAERLRAVHRAAIQGRSADVRAADQAHHAATRQAQKDAISIAEGAGERVTEATRQAIARTLEALPAADRPGRLTRPLEPSGFALLAGIEPAARSKVLPFPETGAGKKRPTSRAEPKEPALESRQQLARARKAVADAERALTKARADARAAETEHQQAKKQVGRARDREARAREALDSAEKDVREATADVDRAAAAARTAADELEAAEAALRRARAQLESANG